MKNVLRSRLVLAAQLAQTIIFGVLIGTVFLQIGTDQAGQRKRLPVLFFVCINQGVFNALILINSCTRSPFSLPSLRWLTSFVHHSFFRSDAVPSERLIVLREREAGTYYVSAYYVAKMLAEMLIQSFFPLIFSCIVYFLIGLQVRPHMSLQPRKFPKAHHESIDRMMRASSSSSWCSWSFARSLQHRWPS